MPDRALLDDLIAKLRETEEQLSMATLEATPQSLLAARIRMGLEGVKHKSADAAPRADRESRPQVSPK